MTVNRLAWLPGYLLFFMMLALPTSYQLYKAGLLAVVTIMLVLKIILDQGRLRIHGEILFITLATTTTGLFFVWLGNIRINPGALRVVTVFLLWPWVYTLFLSGISKERFLQLIKVMAVAACFITIYNFHYVLYATGKSPIYLPLKLNQSIGVYSGFIEFSTSSLDTLFFLVPFFLAALLVCPAGMVVSRKWLWVIVGMGMINVLLSGRRALLLVIALSPLITIFFQMFLPKIERKKHSKTMKFVMALGFVLVTGMLLILKSIYDIKLSSIVTFVKNAFMPSVDESASLRQEQLYSLLNGWSDHPLFGSGLGAAASMVRSEEMPWAYELQYFAMLFHVGLVGFMIYALCIGWIYYKIIRMIKEGSEYSRYAIPVVVGLTCFLIANASNPYLGKYDLLWTLFLPIALINVWLRQRSR